MADYNRKAAAAIREAYSALVYIAECSNMDAPRRLNDAERYESRQRGALNAKLLMVREAFAALQDARRPAADLFTISPGLATAYMFAAWADTQSGRVIRLVAQFSELAHVAIAHHDTAQAARFAALEGEGC